MNKEFSRTSTEPSQHGKLNLWQSLVEPVATITEASERRQATLVSTMLLALALSLIGGVVYMGFFSSNPIIGFVLAGADISLGMTYVLSRTRHYRLAVFMCLFVLAMIPVLNVGLGTEHSVTGRISWRRESWINGGLSGTKTGSCCVAGARASLVGSCALHS